MTMTLLQPSFAGGEISPSLTGRVDLQRYGICMSKLENFIVHPQGGISTRPGTEFIAATKYADKKSRLIPFEFSTEQSYVIEFGDGYCRFFMNGGAIYNDQNVLYEISSPYYEEDLDDIKFVQSADVLYIAHPKYSPRQLTRYGHANWVMESFKYKDGPFMKSNTDKDIKVTPSGTSGDIILVATGDIFNSGQIGSLFKITQYCQGSTVTKHVDGAGVYTDSIKCNYKWRMITNGQWAGVAELQVSDDNATWKTYVSFSSRNDYNAIESGEVDDDDPKYFRVLCTEMSAAVMIVNLSTFPYYHNGIVKITGVIDSRTATATVINELAETLPTWEWAEGSWSDYRSWPTAATFYQDRLIFGGTNGEPQTAWGSVVSEYDDFSTSYIIKDDDTVSANLASRRINKIENLIDLGDILAFTNSAVWVIGPSGDNGILTPSTIKSRWQENTGSSKVEPVTIGTRVIFIQQMGGCIRDGGYSVDSDGFKSDDISLFAKHLFDGYTINQMAYQQNPDSIIWMVRSDGVLIGLTYLREQQVLAWHHHITDGQVESICTIPGDGYDEIWMTVKRGNKRFVERLTQRMQSKDPADQWYVDCGLKYEGEPADIISGLNHLEGKEVAVLADGFVIKKQNVTDGKITLPFKASKVIVGLPYVCEAETLKPEVQSYGTIQSKKVQIPKLTIKYLNTRGGWIGPDEESLVEILELASTNINEVTPLQSKDITTVMEGGYNDDGHIIIKQVDPLPMTILSIIPEVNASR